MKKAHEILNFFLENSQIQTGETYHSFFRSWVKIAGLDAAAHSRVKDIRGSIVFIEVDHPGWIQIIQMKKQSILKKIQKSYPELGIRELRLQLFQSREA